MGNAWSIIKGVWGVVITIFTAFTAYGQYQVSAMLLRPIITVEGVSAPRGLKEAHGRLSHVLRIMNRGQIPAEAAHISVVTRIDGSRIHEDMDQPLGLIVPQQMIGYVIHAQPPRTYDAAKHRAYEEVRITYKGLRRFPQLWCKPEYVYTFTNELRADDWIGHKEPAESESCS